MPKSKIEYYILAGDKGMKQELIDKGIDISPTSLLIVSKNSEIGKLVRKKAREEWKNWRKKNE